MAFWKKFKRFFMTEEAIRSEVDCELCDDLSAYLKREKDGMHRLEKKNYLIEPIFRYKLWESASFLIENGYRLEQLTYLNAPMQAKSLAYIWMSDPLFYQMLSVSTPTLLNHQDKEGNTILHTIDTFSHHMEFGRADIIASRVIDFMHKGADITIQNKEGSYPLKKIIERAGYIKNHNIRTQFLTMVQKQREHIKD